MSDDDVEEPTTQTTILSADMGVLYDLPLEIGEELVFGQTAALYIGGTQQFNFESPWISMAASLDIYPLWVDLLKNEFHFYSEDLTACDVLSYGWEIGKVSLAATIGFKQCNATVYDNFFETETTTHTCAFEYQ